MNIVSHYMSIGSTTVRLTKLLKSGKAEYFGDVIHFCIVLFLRSWIWELTHGAVPEVGIKYLSIGTYDPGVP